MNQLEIKLAADVIDEELSELKKALAKHLNTSVSTLPAFSITKKSLDARSRNPFFIYRISLGESMENMLYDNDLMAAPQVAHASPVHIIGAGPAGLFCAIQCIVLGLKPILFERGKRVRDRRRDLAVLNKVGILNEESNYCFGEGGAGTYSDGKLYTRSKKRGDWQKVLTWFHHFGAKASILYEAHPHIGTNKLPGIIEAIRNFIISCGGEVHFESKLTDITLQFDRISHIQINHNNSIPIHHLVLATGHSAHDIYELLHRKKIYIEPKPFALGVRIEHPQAIINQLQYRCDTHLIEKLPPASYSLAEQINGRGVFSFCMCPGGIIAPASTRQGTLVVNGWSPSKRNNRFANSGMVVSLDMNDFGSDSPLAGLAYQYAVEQRVFQAGGGHFVAPAQRMTDFLTKKTSNSLPACSYLPGVSSQNLHDVLPEIVSDSLRAAFILFDKKWKNQASKSQSAYLTNEAIIVATESRTSSPVRIPRHKDTFTHLHIQNLYPCAEGAGYAGGIVSAAMDGINIAKLISRSVEV
jgi:Uncharacterized FAD-dependent dehydrogenases